MKTRILTIMSESQRGDIVQHLSVDNVEVLEAVSCLQARKIMKAQAPLQVVLVAPNLPDGSWQTVLSDVVAHRIHPAVIVCVKAATIEFWCNALEQGAYDLLLEPYRRKEVRAVVEAAAAQSIVRSAFVGGASICGKPLTRKSDAAENGS